MAEQIKLRITRLYPLEVRTSVTFPNHAGDSTDHEDCDDDFTDTIDPNHRLDKPERDSARQATV